VAEWRLDSPHVENVLARRAAHKPAIEERIAVPASIYEWKASETDRSQAFALQLENRRRFQVAFSQGLAVFGFERDPEGNGIYKLGQLSQLQLD
jgi:hypothetical protein